MYRPTLFILLLVGGLAVTGNAVAQKKLYRYVDDKGVVHYSERPRIEATGKQLDTLNRQGAVVKQSGPALTAEEVAEREAEKRRQQEEAIRAREERRRNEALLATYSSEEDIDRARARAIGGLNEARAASEKRLADALKQQEKFKAELEFYQKKPVPVNLQQQVKNNELEISIQRDLLAKKDKELEAITAKYDEDKRRYLEITRGGEAKPSAPASASTAAAAVDKK